MLILPLTAYAKITQKKCVGGCPVGARFFWGGAIFSSACVVVVKSGQHECLRVDCLTSLSLCLARPSPAFPNLKVHVGYENGQSLFSG